MSWAKIGTISKVSQQRLYPPGYQRRRSVLGIIGFDPVFRTSSICFSKRKSARSAKAKGPYISLSPDRIEESFKRVIDGIQARLPKMISEWVKRERRLPQQRNLKKHLDAIGHQIEEQLLLRCLGQLQVALKELVLVSTGLDPLNIFIGVKREESGELIVRFELGGRSKFPANQVRENLMHVRGIYKGGERYPVESNEVFRLLYEKNPFRQIEEDEIFEKYWFLNILISGLLRRKLTKEFFDDFERRGLHPFLEPSLCFKADLIDTLTPDFYDESEVPGIFLTMIPFKPSHCVFSFIESFEESIHGPLPGLMIEFLSQTLRRRGYDEGMIEAILTEESFIDYIKEVDGIVYEDYLRVPTSSNFQKSIVFSPPQIPGKDDKTVSIEDVEEVILGRGGTAVRKSDSPLGFFIVKSRGPIKG